MVATTTAPRTRRPNVETPARWDAALDRAYAKRIQVWQDAETGDFLALSSDATKVYTVRWYTCTCQAAEAGDPVCQHRAMFRAHCQEEDRATVRMLAEQRDEELVGMSEAELDRLMAEPTIPWDADTFDRMMEGTTVLSVPADSQRVETIPAPVRACTDCLGTGTARMYTGGRHNEWVAVTCGCQRRAA